MKELARLSAIIMGAALLSAAPFSLRLSPERIVSLSLDTAAAAKIGATGPRGPVSGAYLARRPHIGPGYTIKIGFISTTDCELCATWCIVIITSRPLLQEPK